MDSMTDPASSSVAAAGHPHDPALDALGVRVFPSEPGVAEATMTVRADMINTHGVCHGGLVLLLADTALAYASTAEGRQGVTASCEAHFVQPARLGDALCARAVTAWSAEPDGRRRVVDVVVSTSDGTVVALVRGQTVRPR